MTDFAVAPGGHVFHIRAQGNPLGRWCDERQPRPALHKGLLTRVKTYAPAEEPRMGWHEDYSQDMTCRQSRRRKA